MATKTKKKGKSKSWVTPVTTGVFARPGKCPMCKQKLVRHDMFSKGWPGAKPFYYCETKGCRVKI